MKNFTINLLVDLLMNVEFFNDKSVDKFTINLSTD